MSFFSWIKSLFHQNHEVLGLPEELPKQPVQEAQPSPKFNDVVIKYPIVTSKQADELLSNLERYKAVAIATGVPAAIIGCIHCLEASFNFNTCLHNGDPLPGPTTHVPKGRGPFESWELAAIDALKLDGLVSQVPLTIDVWLYKLEEYNGLGYRKHRINSPYIWSGTQFYSKGKYVEDGIFDSEAVSSQIGAAALLKDIQQRGLLNLDLPK